MHKWPEDVRIVVIGMHARTRSIDDLFDVLSNRQQRRLLVTLLHHDPQTAELRVPDDIVPEGAPDTLVIELHHVHLPKLDTLGFIEWDRRSNSIERGPTFEELRPLLTVIDEHSAEFRAPWP